MIFALSNPTSQAECTAAQAYGWSNGKAVFASGSPFPEWKSPSGQVFHPGQGNNSYIFPGLAMGVLVAASHRVTERMFYIAAKTLASQVTKNDLAHGCVYPPLDTIRCVSAHIAAAVATESYDAQLATILPRPSNMLQAIQSAMYNYNYANYA